MLSYCHKLLRRALTMFIALVKVMLPVMVVVKFGQELGLVSLLGRWLAPAMSLLDLPAEAGIIWATTLLTGLYGGIAAIVSLSPTLTTGQLSALCAMMLFAHAIPLEQAIVRRAGASFWLTAALRIGTGLIYGGSVAWLSRFTGWLDTPVSFDWLQGSTLGMEAENASWWSWLQETALTLAMTLGVILGLLLLLDGLERLGLVRRFTALLLPLLRLSGLDARVASVTTVGVLLGITYGGALIIDEAEKQQLSARTRFLALSWLSLSHSLIEDTLLMLALGADIWVVLVGRIAITLVIVALLAKLTAAFTRASDESCLPQGVKQASERTEN